MTLPSYFTGTVSVEAGGTTVTGSGTIWTGGNAREGDDFVIAGTLARIVEVVSATSLTITPWTGATESGAEYVIYQNAARRFDDVRIADDLRKQVAALNNQGYPHIVPNDAAAPDPSLGDEGQPAIQFDTWQWWQKQGGVWDPKGTPAGLLPANNLSELTNAADALTNLGGTTTGKAVFTAVDAAAARAGLAAIGGGRKVVLSSSTTYVRPANLIFAIVECVGGGGGGSGCATSTAVATSEGNGGGGGGYSVSSLTAAQIGVSQVVTIGAGGVGGAGDAVGSAGGTTSFGSLVIANGGGGGNVGTSRSPAVGGTVGTGDFKIAGSYGSLCKDVSLSGSENPSGDGAPGPFGGAAKTVFDNHGRKGTAPGAGGSAGHSFNASGGKIGGAGADGIIIVTEFYSRQ